MFALTCSLYPKKDDNIGTYVTTLLHLDPYFKGTTYVCNLDSQNRDYTH